MGQSGSQYVVFIWFHLFPCCQLTFATCSLLFDNNMLDVSWCHQLVYVTCCPLGYVCWLVWSCLIQPAVMVSHGADICWATGNPWPLRDVLMAWALEHVNDRTLFRLGEAIHLRDHILKFWDIGALRTLWAYFHTDIPELEQFLLHYHLDWHKGGGKWCCINPSACLVWQVRSFWRRHPVQIWHLQFYQPVWR